MALLGRPEAHRARLTLKACEALGVSPSAFLGRPAVTSYIYGEGDEKDRVVRTVVSSQWTPEDQALMLAWTEYEASLCGQCGHPKATAWHPDNEDAGFEVVDEITCWACTAMQVPDDDMQRKPVTFPVVVDTRDYDLHPLPPTT